MIPRIFRRHWMPGLMEDYSGNDYMNQRFTGAAAPTVPDVNVVETEKDYRIELAAPGLDKKDFNIDLQNDILTISSEKKDESEEKDENFMRREFNYTSFRRSFTIPESVKSDDIKAKHENGILKVHIPKKEESIEKGPKQISIS